MGVMCPVMAVKTRSGEICGSSLRRISTDDRMSIRPRPAFCLAADRASEGHYEKRVYGRPSLMAHGTDPAHVVRFDDDTLQPMTQGQAIMGRAHGDFRISPGIERGATDLLHRKRGKDLLDCRVDRGRERLRLQRGSDSPHDAVAQIGEARMQLDQRCLRP